MAEVNCAKCQVTLNLFKVRYNDRYYCPRCMDDVSEEYLERMRHHKQIMREGTRIEDV